MISRATPTLTQFRRQDERDEDMRPLDLRLISRLYRYTLPYATQRNWLLLIVILRSIQLPLLVWSIGAIIKGPIAAGDVRGIVLGVTGYVLLALATQFCVHFRQRLALELGERVVHDLRNDLFEHLQQMPMSFFHTTRLGRIISRMTSDVEYVRMGVQEVLFVTLVAAGQMIVSAVFMLWYDWVLFLLVLCIVPALWALNRSFTRKLSVAHRQIQESFSRVTATLAESVNGIRVTQGFVRQDTNAEMFGDLVSDHAEYNLSLTRTQGLFQRLLDLNNQAFVAVLLIVGGYRVLMSHDVQVGDLVGFFFMANLFFSPINSLGVQYNHALTAMAGAERVFQLLDQTASQFDSPTAIDIGNLRGRVEFRDLTFGYDRNRPVLHDLNFLAEPGQTIALVGHTGGGKTSIMNLLAKFYPPTSGNILIDGVALEEITTRSLRKQLGLVLQQNFLFTGTVMENIRVGRAGASDEAVVDALRRLDCLDLILQLPQGLQTSVGERGIGLSLGQRQLICFARALLADPAILFLDEATSSVDTLTEARIQRALTVLLRGRTSFVVAHRLSTIRHADQILVIDGGRILERGTHAGLLANGGMYATLYRHFVRGHEVA